MVVKNDPYADFKIVLMNSHKISSFLPYKDCLRFGMLSFLLYKFSYSQTSASATNVATTSRVHQRGAEHSGLSSRTGVHWPVLTVATPGPIRIYAGAVWSYPLGLTPGQSELVILESLYPLSLAISE